MIYLDHNSTTLVHLEVKRLIFDLMGQALNPSSIHTSGRAGRKIIESARSQVAEAAGINTNNTEYQIIFTASGTEANNLMISNFKDADIFISAIEHASILAQAIHFPNIKVIRVDSNGIVDLEELKLLLSQSTRNKKLVSVMQANNETGVLQPIEEIVKIAHSLNAFVHSDCVQSLGKINLNIQELGIDFATISAHKFGGPIGAAALITRSNYPLKPIIIGGGQEKGIRSGTENVPAIAGFGLAAQIAANELESRKQNMSSLQARLENNLVTEFPDVTIVARNTPRLPNTSLIIMPGVEVETQLIAFDLKGIQVSSGSACYSGKIGKSKVLKAMGLEEDKINSAIRVSIGYEQTPEDIDNFIKAFAEIYRIRKAA